MSEEWTPPDWRTLEELQARGVPMGADGLPVDAGWVERRSDGKWAYLVGWELDAKDGVSV